MQSTLAHHLFQSCVPLEGRPGEYADVVLARDLQPRPKKGDDPETRVARKDARFLKAQILPNRLRLFFTPTAYLELSTLAFKGVANVERVEYELGDEVQDDHPLFSAEKVHRSVDGTAVVYDGVVFKRAVKVDEKKFAKGDKMDRVVARVDTGALVVDGGVLQLKPDLDKWRKVGLAVAC